MAARKKRHAKRRRPERPPPAAGRGRLLTLDLTDAAYTYLEALLGTGLFGEHVQAVAERLLMQALGDTIRKPWVRRMFRELEG